MGGGKHFKGKLLEMAATIVASVKEMMKHSSLLCVIHRGKKTKLNAITYTVTQPQGPWMQVEVAWTIIIRRDCASRIFKPQDEDEFPATD